VITYIDARLVFDGAAFLRLRFASLVEITSKKGWRHLIAPSSGQWGSTRIDQAFWQLLCDVFGDVMEKWRIQRPGACCAGHEHVAAVSWGFENAMPTEIAC